MFMFLDFGDFHYLQDLKHLTHSHPGKLLWLQEKTPVTTAVSGYKFAR